MKNRRSRILQVVFLAVVSSLSPFFVIDTSVASRQARTSLNPQKGQAVSVEIYNTWSVSPQGDRLALPVWRSAKQSTYLLIVDLKGSCVRCNVNDANEPAWSYDGELLAFSEETGREINPFFTASSIGLYSWRNGSSTTMSTANYVDKYPSWSNDGKAIAFARIKMGNPLKLEGTDAQIMIASLGQAASSGVHAVGPNLIHMSTDMLQWRPSHNEIAFIGVANLRLRNDKPVRLNDIYLLNVGKSSLEKLTQSHDIEHYSHALIWSPDGRYIAFVTGIRHSQTLEVMDVGSRKRTVIFRTSNPKLRGFRKIESLNWSPDGRRLVFTASRYDLGQGNIGIIEWPNREFKWLTQDHLSKAPRWTSDDKIMFIHNGNEIWQMAPDGSRSKKVYAVSR